MNITGRFKGYTEDLRTEVQPIIKSNPVEAHQAYEKIMKGAQNSLKECHGREMSAGDKLAIQSFTKFSSTVSVEISERIILAVKKIEELANSIKT